MLSRAVCLSLSPNFPNSMSTKSGQPQEFGNGCDASGVNSHAATRRFDALFIQVRWLAQPANFRGASGVKSDNSPVPRLRDRVSITRKRSKSRQGTEEIRSIEP